MQIMCNSQDGPSGPGSRFTPDKRQSGSGFLSRTETHRDSTLRNINEAEGIVCVCAWTRWQRPALSFSRTGTAWRADFPSTRPPDCAQTSTWTSSVWRRTALKRWPHLLLHSHPQARWSKQSETLSLETEFGNNFMISPLYSKWIMQIWQYHLPPNKEANWLFKHNHKLVDHKANWIRVHIRMLIAASCNDNLRWCPKCCLVVMSCINMFH